MFKIQSHDVVMLGTAASRVRCCLGCPAELNHATAERFGRRGNGAPGRASGSRTRIH